VADARISTKQLNSSTPNAVRLIRAPRKRIEILDWPLTFLYYAGHLAPNDDALSSEKYRYSKMSISNKPVF
jgi:hypothetical protein